MSSGLFDTKYSNICNTNDSHPLFNEVCDLMASLEQKRIIEKIARPISQEAKVKIME